jgi:hypothetical protein
VGGDDEGLRETEARAEEESAEDAQGAPQREAGQQKGRPQLGRGRAGAQVRLEPLYRIRFTCPEGGTSTSPEESSTSTSPRVAAKVPSAAVSVAPTPPAAGRRHVQARLPIMFELHGYGRAYPAGRRQIVGAVFHLSSDGRYSRLYDVVLRLRRRGARRSCVSEQGPDLVVDVGELVWEPIAQ